MIVTDADEHGAAAEAFGAAFRKKQSESYGCVGIECTFKMDGNCHCFNATLARHRELGRLQGLEEGVGRVQGVKGMIGADAREQIALLYAEAELRAAIHALMGGSK